MNFLYHPFPKVNTLMAPVNRQTQVDERRSHHITVKDGCEATKRKLTQSQTANSALREINPKPIGKLEALQYRLNIENTFGISLTKKQSIVCVL